METIITPIAEVFANLLFIACIVWAYKERHRLMRIWTQRRMINRPPEVNVRLNEAVQELLEVSELYPLDISDDLNADTWKTALASVQAAVQSPTHTVQFNHHVAFFWRWKMRRDLKKAAHGIGATYEVREVKVNTGYLFIVSMSSHDAEALSNAVSQWTHVAWKTAVTH